MKQRLYLLCVALLFGCIAVGYTATVKPDPSQDGSYTDTLPDGKSGPSSTLYKTANVQGPIASHDWWAPIITNHASGNSYRCYADPAIFKCNTDGLLIGYAQPSVSSDGKTIFCGRAADPESDRQQLLLQGVMSGGSVVTATDPLVDGYSDWAVTTTWKHASDPTKYFTATMGQGFVFTYTEFSAGVDPKISFPFEWSTGQFDLLNESGNTIGWDTTVTTDRVILRFLRYSPERYVYYGLFAPTGTQFRCNGDVIEISLPTDNRYFSIGLLPSTTDSGAKDDLAALYDYAYAFVTNTKVSWSVDTAHSTVATTFELATTKKRDDKSSTPLIALFPHQWNHSTNSYLNKTFSTLRGTMKLCATSSFQVSNEFYGITPFLPDKGTYDKSNLATLLDTDISLGGAFSDPRPYWQGKKLYELATMIPIAEQLGNATTQQYLITTLHNRLADWLTYTAGETNKFLYYDSTWGTMIAYEDGDEFHSADELNDHHLQYGYFVYAAAILAMYDAHFASEYGAMIEMLIKDYACPTRTDEKFPFLRNMSPYEGHSWATTGLAASNDGLNQESSSEAMNAYAALYLWGLATSNQTYKDVGMWGYTTEYSAIHDYYFDSDDQTYPSDYTHKTIGILWGGKADYSTWFGSAPEYVHGIQFLPITPSMLYLGYDTTYDQQNYNDLVATHGGTENLWQDTIWPFQALYDPTAVLAKYIAGILYSNTTRSFLYYWIHELNRMGTVDTSIYADNGTYAVFNKNGKKVYIAYNPTDTAQTVTFYDRTSGLSVCSLAVSSHTLATRDVPIAPSALSAVAVSSTNIQFSWADNATNETGYRLYSSTGWLIQELAVAGTTTYIQTMLTANTSSYITTVKAYNADGESDAATCAIIFSSANAPGTSDFANVYRSSFTAQWSANDNSTITVYCVQISTTNNFSAITSSSNWITNFSNTFTNLSEGTTYYARVKARNGNSIETNYTSLDSTCTTILPVPCAPTNFSGVALSSTRIQFSWTASTSTNVTGYRLYSSTGIWTEITQTSWTQTGLTANTSSHITIVKAYNESGESASATLASVVYSSANAPTSTSFSDVWKSSVTVSWDANVNRDGTSYTIEISTKSDDFTVAKSSTVVTTNVVYTFVNLDEGTTYYARVKAKNGNNIATSYTSFGSTVTYTSEIPVPPGPTGFSGVTLSSTTIHFSWTDHATNETGYRLYSSTGWLIQERAEVNRTSWTQTTMLTANTSSYVTILKAYNDGGESAATTLASVVFSSANAPIAVGFEDVFISSVTTRWSANGNSSTTTYCVQISTDNFSSIVTSNTWNGSVAYTFTSLNEGTTYYARVKARNGNNVETSYISLASTCTQRSSIALPVAPTNFSGIALSSTSIQFSWTASTSTNVTGYRLYSSTGMWTEIAQTSWTQTGLTANTSSYVTILKAYNGGGESSGVSSTSIVYSSANAPSAADFLNVYRSSVTAQWTSNGNSTSTEYCVSIATVNNFSVIKTSSTWIQSFAYTFTSLNEGTTYYARVNARNGNNVGTRYTVLGSTTTLRTPDDTTPPKARITIAPVSPLSCGAFTITLRVEESSSLISTPTLACVYADSTSTSLTLTQQSTFVWQSTSYIQTTTPQGTAYFIFHATDTAGNHGTEIVSGETFIVDTSIPASTGGTASNADGTRVLIPAHTLTVATRVTITTTTSSSDAFSSAAFEDAAMQSFLATTQLYREFLMKEKNSGAPVTSFASPVEITIPYTDAVVDATHAHPDDLRLYYFDSTHTRWTLVPGSSVDTTQKIVTGDVYHFSLYAILPVPSITTSDAFCAYPNPFYPNKDALLHIINIPSTYSDIVVEIYDIAGIIVRRWQETELQDDTTTHAKTVTWDGYDQNTKKAATGVYIIVVRAKEGVKREKVAVLW